jgi:hypothetical protein
MSNTGPIIPHWTDKNSGIKYSLNLNGNMPDEEFTSWYFYAISDK